MKKIVAILLSVLMLLASVTAFAAGTGAAIMISGSSSEHKYELYQLFVGDVTTIDGEQRLTNIQYGSGINAAGRNALGSAPELASHLSAISNGSLDEWIDENKVYLTPSQTVPSTGTTARIPVSTEGYYLIRDVEGSLEGKYESYTNYIVRVVGQEDVEIAAKASVPTVTKKVKENNKAVQGSETIPLDASLTKGYNDVADYDIGDHVPFLLYATLPSDLDEYSAAQKGHGYYLEFADNLSAGLTYDAGSMKVYLQHTTGAPVQISDGWYNEISGSSVRVIFKDLTEMAGVDAGTKIVVAYTATLNEGAEIGLPGNENSVKLIFSNNPTSDGKGDRGETPEDKVVVFTYQLKVIKQNAQQNADGEHTRLKGAKFVIEEDELEGSAYVATGRYAVINGGKIAWTGSWDEAAGSGTATQFETDEHGEMKVVGLDAGHYTLHEIEAPVGYAKLDRPVNFTIQAFTVNNQNWTGKANDALDHVSIEVAGSSQVSAGAADVGAGMVSMIVNNTSMSQLPTTGSEGTMVMMALGVLILIAAGVIVIGHNKRQMFRI